MAVIAAVIVAVIVVTGSTGAKAAMEAGATTAARLAPSNVAAAGTCCKTLSQFPKSKRPMLIASAFCFCPLLSSYVNTNHA